MATWSREDLVTLVGTCEIYVLDAAAALVPVPPWLLMAGAVELTQSIGERMELVHPDDRATILEIDGMVDEIWGCPSSELIGSSATRFLAPECFASAGVMWANLMANPGATAASRQRVIRPDGSSLWIDSFLVSRPQPD